MYTRLALCFALTLIGCSQPDKTIADPNTTVATSTATATPPAAATPSAGLSDSDAALLKDGAADSLAETQLGELAVKQAGSPEVKEIGEMLVKDHARVRPDLEKLASSKNLQLPTDLPSEWKDTLVELQKLQGDKFDQEFLEEIVEHLRKDVDSYSKAAQSATDPDVKSVLETGLVITRMHLDKAVRLADKRDIKGD